MQGTKTEFHKDRNPTSNVIVTSPYEREIPFEILSKILVTGTIHSTFNPSASTWTYMRVSKLWRSVALESGELWTRIYIDRRVLARQGPRLRAHLDFVLERSRGRPLFVALDMKGVALGSRTEHRDFLDTLLGTCRRWKSFHLSYSWFLNPFNSSSDGPERFPNLTEITLKSVLPLETLYILRNAPRLEKLVIQRGTLSPDSPSSGRFHKLSFPCLKVLSITDCATSPDWWPHLSRHAPKLEELVIDGGSFKVPPTVPTITLSKLRTLVIRVPPTQLPNFVFPELKNLEVVALPEGLSEAIRIVDRSSCHVKKISVTEIGLLDLEHFLRLRSVNISLSRSALDVELAGSLSTFEGLNSIIRYEDTGPIDHRALGKFLQSCSSYHRGFDANFYDSNIETIIGLFKIVEKFIDRCSAPSAYPVMPAVRAAMVLFAWRRKHTVREEEYRIKERALAIVKRLDAMHI
ncbi:hypothetical protein V5O48_016697 [Marasmius crinis-equi]|uniref:F-box domain-containing protein n=1 Tax=Marasmius crinis-equi TaxID=585013 RepID=A0ABR3ER05_9AGAR